jgi:drug/metabolite transporter (DMT)-like permease
MFNHRQLVDTIPLVQSSYANPFVLKHCPTFKNVNHLKLTVMNVPLVNLILLGLTIGTIYQKRFCTTMDLKTGTAIQLAGAAVAALVLALVFETRVVSWTGEFVLALTWLIVVLTVGAYMLLFYLLAIGAASKVASLFYLTPPTTAVMGYFVFNETFGVVGLIGMAVAVVGYMMAVR